MRNPLYLFTPKSLTDAAVIDWEFDLNPAFVSISDTRTLDITGPVSGHPTELVLAVTHTVAGTALVLPGDDTHVNWAPGAGETTLLRAIWTGSAYIWSSNVPGTTGNTTPDAPTGGTVDDTANTFTFTLNPSYTAAEHEYSINGGAYADCASNVINVGDVAVGIGELLVRVKAGTGRNASATLSNAEAFTVSGGGGAEYFTYSQETNAQISPGNGTWYVINNAAFPAGGTATKKLAKSNGNYIEFEITAPTSDCDTMVLCLDDNNDGIYTWGTSMSILSGMFISGTTSYAHTGDTAGGTTTNLSTAPAAGDLFRLEVSGDDVLVKINGTLKHTHTGVLSGITNLYIKTLRATMGSGTFLHGRGVGLTAI